MATRLYGTGRAECRNPPVFSVDYPDEGTFCVLLAEVAGPAVLEIHVDGNRAVRHEVSGGGRRLPPAEEAVVSVPVSPGHHEIRVLNAGADWMRVRAYLLTGYRDVRECADLCVYALQGPDCAALWAHNVCDGFLARTAAVDPVQQKGCSVTLRGLADGVYQWERWDTRTGQAVDRGQSPCTGGAVKLSLPPIATDAAYKITKAR